MALQERSKEILQTPVPVWAALVFVAFVVAAATWWWPGSDGKQGAKRWSKGGDVQETERFAAQVNHAQDSKQSPIPAPGKPPSDVSDLTLPRLSVYSVANVRPPHPNPTLRDLGDRAQVRAIDAIESASDKKIHPWDDLRKTLDSDEEPGERDPYLFERVLVATIAKGMNWPPGDRMVWTRVLVKPINFKFAGYTIAATESETLKISSIEATNVRKLSADIGLAIPGLDGSKIGLTPSSENTLKRTSDITAQYERLGVDITPSFLRIIRESGAGGDVIGNTTVALSMITDPVLLLADKDKEPPVSDIQLVVTAAQVEDSNDNQSMTVLPLVPLPHCALRGKISAIFEQRHIKPGSNIYYDESQQDVTFIHDASEERTVEMIGADDVSPFVWSIQIVPEGKQPEKSGSNGTLSGQFGGGHARNLLFSDYGRAVKVAHWVRTHSGSKLSGYSFNWKENDKSGLFVVKQTDDDCKKPVEVQAQRRSGEEFAQDRGL